MAVKELPNDRPTLEHLLQCTVRLTEHMEPMRQQVKNVLLCIADMLAGNFTDLELFTEVRNALCRSLAAGIPPHQVLADYLDQDPPLPPITDPSPELSSLRKLIHTDNATKSQREGHEILEAFRLCQYRDSIDAFVDRCHVLHRRIVEKLAAPTEPIGKTMESVRASNTEMEESDSFRDRKEQILETLLLHKADGRRRRVSRRTAALQADRYGPTASYNKAIASLVKEKLLESQRGAGGGIWLTKAGKEAAEKLPKPANDQNK